MTIHECFSYCIWDIYRKFMRYMTYRNSPSRSYLPPRPPPPHQPQYPLSHLPLCPPPARLHHPLHQQRRHHQVQAFFRLSLCSEQSRSPRPAAHVSPWRTRELHGAEDMARKLSSESLQGAGVRAVQAVSSRRMVSDDKWILFAERQMCVFITAGPITKLCAWGEEDSGGHVL